MSPTYRNNLDGSHAWIRFNYDDPVDLAILTENGLIWKTSERGQQRAIDALIAGTIPMNDKVPPKIAEWVVARQAEREA